MALFLLKIFIFIMFFQPTYIFPSLEIIKPFRMFALLTIFFYFFSTEKSTSKFTENKYTKYFLLFVGMQIISASAIWLHGGMQTLIGWINYIIIYYLIVKLCNDNDKINSIITIIVLSLVYLSINSTYDVSKSDMAFKAVGYGWYENGNDLVLILISAIPLAFYIVEKSNHLMIKIFFLSIVALFSFNILFTQSRQGLIGLVIINCLCLFISKNIPKPIRTGLTILTLLSVFIVGLSVVLSRPDLSGKLLGDDSSQNRLEQWEACLRMVKHNPFLGVGPNETISYMRDYGGIPGLAPHNTLIQVFAEVGIPGGVFFLIFSCYPIIDALIYFRKKNNKRNFKADLTYKYLILSLSGFWSCAIFSNRVHFTILYVIVALIVAVHSNCNITINERTYNQE